MNLKKLHSNFLSLYRVLSRAFQFKSELYHKYNIHLKIYVTSHDKNLDMVELVKFVVR